LIFANGFEAGNLNAWDDSETDGGDLYAAASAAMQGAYGLRANVDDNDMLYVQDNTPDDETSYRARFYFDPNGINMNSGNTHTIFAGYQDSSTKVLRVDLRYSGGNYQIRAGLRNNGDSWTYSNWFTISNAPHAIEVAWQAGSSGSLTLWIDGTQRAVLSGINNSNREIDRARMGAVDGVDSGTRGTYYFDAFESRHFSNIGS
jgi:hypothetical protein